MDNDIQAGMDWLLIGWALVAFVVLMGWVLYSRGASEE